MGSFLPSILSGITALLGSLNGETKPPNIGLNKAGQWLEGHMPNVIGAVGSILGQVKSEGYIRKMNRYNEPVNQLERLRKAGLPMAAYSHVGAGNQSAIPQQGIGQAGDYLSKFLDTDQTKANTASTLELLRGISADSDMKAYDRNVYLSDFVGDDNRRTTLREEQIQTGIALQKAQVALQRHSGTIASIDAEAKEQLRRDGKLNAETYARIELLGKQMGLIGQHTEMMKSQQQALENDNRAMQEIIKRMDKNGMSLGESLLLMFLQKGKAAAGGSGFNIGL